MDLLVPSTVLYNKKKEISTMSSTNQQNRDRVLRRYAHGWKMETHLENRRLGYKRQINPNTCPHTTNAYAKTRIPGSLNGCRLFRSSVKVGTKPQI